MREKQAHPVTDEANRVAVFHNGFVTNFKDLAKELFPHKDASKLTLSDSEVVALFWGKLLDEGHDIKMAIKTLVETKLIGTWHLAIVLTAQPDKIFVTKNAGPVYMGKRENAIVICSDQGIISE